MKANEEDKPERLPSISGPGTGPANLSAPPEVEGYEILRILGEGGMGVVYLARQKVPVQRLVALKIVKPGMDSKRVIARFEAEEQALALLDHPNIAQVYDAGATNDGHPYFSMEYVEGLSISEHCDKCRLSIEERLRLFIQVCEGVQHAHQKGIIHRDIKPSNVLVYTDGNKPLPKIIDFGVAKALTAPLTERTLFTEQGQLLGTPEYMSPEQAEMTSQDIDTRSDIYSLGILLYELLTGTTPFSKKELRLAGYLEMQRVIREGEPAKPSTKLSTLGATLTDIAKLRSSNPNLLRKTIRGDLDWIVMKSLDKNRKRRYESVGVLAADVQRHLNDDPVLARPPSTAYRLRKLLHKHRLRVVVSLAGVVMVVVLAVTLVMWNENLNRLVQVESLEHKAILSEARGLYAAGEFVTALRKVESILRSRHVGSEAWLLKASLLVEGRHPEEAADRLNNLFDERPEIAGVAHALLARIYWESGVEEADRLKAINEHRRKALELLPATAEAYFLRALVAPTIKERLEFLDTALDLDPGYYEAVRYKAFTHNASKDYIQMQVEARIMTALRPQDPWGYHLSAIAHRETGSYEEAIKYLDRAIHLTPEEDVRFVELYRERYLTHIRMAKYEDALRDAQKCAHLQEEDKFSHFQVFCALVRLGRHEDAAEIFRTVFQPDSQAKARFNEWSRRYVFETLGGGQQLRLPNQAEQEDAFRYLWEAVEFYRTIEKKAKLLIIDGYGASWSPDGSMLAYHRRISGTGGIEVMELKTGKTQLLTVPGRRPQYSPDGRYIAFIRDSQAIPLSEFISSERVYRRSRVVPYETWDRDEIWLMKADGTEPRRLARGGEHNWGQDSDRVFYISRLDRMLYSISVEDTQPEPVPVISWSRYNIFVSADNKQLAFIDDNILKILDLHSKSLLSRWEVPHEAKLFWWDARTNALILGGDRAGLWIYDPSTGTGRKILSGLSISQTCPSPDGSKLTIGVRTPISCTWLAEIDPNVPLTEALQPSLSVEEHYQEKANHYSIMISTHPQRADPYLNRAECYLHLGENEEAFADLETYVGLRDWSKPASRCNRLAWNLATGPARSRHPGIALYLAQRAVEKAPGSISYLTTLGAAHYSAGHWQEVVESLQSKGTLSEADANNFFLLAMAHQQLGDRDQAKTWYRRAIRWHCRNNTNYDATERRYSNRMQSHYYGGRPYLIHAEAAELLGTPVKKFNRKPPHTGAQILPVTATVSHQGTTSVAFPIVIDGSGLSDEDHDGLIEHDENPETMWLSEQSKTSSWLEFDLRTVYELDSILVWNYNERGHTKRGIKRADISVWTQDTDWQKITDDTEFAEAEGSFDYDEPTLVEFDGAETQKVRFDDLANLGDAEYIGLSEVRFFESWGSEAIRPHPADGEDIGVLLEAKLSWTSGVGVKADEVYFGTDADSLKYMGRVEAGDSSEVNLPTLEKCHRYWWRVDAEKSDGSMIEGKLWSFLTGRMIGWWRFDQMEGRVTLDSSGSGLDGRLVGGAHIISDAARGNVLSLDGDGDYVNCGNNPAF
ncbi:MAG: protein kinase, partial [Candidatus Bathyarchaeota archaeon]